MMNFIWGTRPISQWTVKSV